MQEMVLFDNPTMQITLRYTYPIVLLFILHCSMAVSHESRQEDVSDARRIMNEVEKGIAGGDVGLFEPFLGPQVAIAMSNDRAGSYSTNQSYSILKNFFGMRKTVRFRFTTIQESASSAYATGGGSFVRRGARENLQIYVRLSMIGTKWAITQINLY